MWVDDGVGGHEEGWGVFLVRSSIRVIMAGAVTVFMVNVPLRHPRPDSYAQPFLEAGRSMAPPGSPAQSPSPLNPEASGSGGGPLGGGVATRSRTKRAGVMAEEGGREGRRGGGGGGVKKRAQQGDSPAWQLDVKEVGMIRNSRACK